MKHEQLQRCWTACWHRARRPIEGVLVSEDQAAAIAEQVIRNVSLDYGEFPTEAEFTARALEEAAEPPGNWSHASGGKNRTTSFITIPKTGATTRTSTSTASNGVTRQRGFPTRSGTACQTFCVRSRSPR
jgi:hypothetical protein